MVWNQSNVGRKLHQSRTQKLSSSHSLNVCDIPLLKNWSSTSQILHTDEHKYIIRCVINSFNNKEKFNHSSQTVVYSCGYVLSAFSRSFIFKKIPSLSYSTLKSLYCRNFLIFMIRFFHA